jgi:hypothetical protein
MGIKQLFQNHGNALNTYVNINLVVGHYHRLIHRHLPPGLRSAIWELALGPVGIMNDEVLNP